MWSENAWAYVIMGVVLLHFVVGFGWLLIKLNKKSGK